MAFIFQSPTIYKVKIKVNQQPPMHKFPILSIN
jgi:hypothetical protein